MKKLSEDKYQPENETLGWIHWLQLYQNLSVFFRAGLSVVRLHEGAFFRWSCRCWGEARRHGQVVPLHPREGCPVHREKPCHQKVHRVSILATQWSTVIAVNLKKVQGSRPSKTRSGQKNCTKLFCPSTAQTLPWVTIKNSCPNPSQVFLLHRP